MPNLPERKHPDALCEECTLCDMKHAETYIPKIRQHNILFIGDAAGEVEGFTNIPFTGPAGKMHWSVLKAVNMNKELYPHTNVCLCFPEQQGKPNFRRPMLRETLCCFPRLRSEIQEIKPKLIIALGDVAMQALTNAKGKISTNRGRFLPLKEDYAYACDVLVALHPSYVMRNRAWIPTQAQTYKQALDYIQGTAKQEFNPELIFDPTAEELHAYLYRNDAPVACDTETTGLNVRQDTILGYSFSNNPNDAVAIWFTGPHDPRWETVRAFLADPTKRKIWQNGSFDVSMLRYSIHSPVKLEDSGFYFDTRLGQQLLNSDLPSDLDYLRGEYTDIPPYKPPKKRIAQIATWGRSEALRYAALDAVTTLHVHDEQLTRLSKQELHLMDDLLLPIVYAIGRMENRGVLVDTDMLVRLYAAIIPELERLEKELAPLKFNVRSSTSTKRRFGLKNTNKETLKYHIQREDEHHEAFAKILEYRTLSKQASTYLAGVYKRLENRRIHTKYKIEGTGTGRLSSQDPNLQNVIPEMRRIYIPDPGYIFLKGDFSQIELWVGAIVVARLTGDESMLNDLLNGKDIHYVACQCCFPHVELKTGTRSSDFTKREINAAKTVTFGTFYGRGPRSIAIMFGVSVAEAQSWQMRLLNHYPGLKSYADYVQGEAKTKGYLTTPFGRRRYITSVTQGVNFPIQSTASDIMLYAIKHADAAGLEPVLTVHDDTVFRVPIKTWKQSFKTIKQIMERPIPQLDGFQPRVDYAKGTNWYELKQI